MKQLVSLVALAFLATGCGSLGNLGSLEEILGSAGAQQTSDVRGQVVRIDSSDRRIDLSVAYVNNLRQNNVNASVYYTDQTVVEYQGNRYAPTDLEAGDEIAVTGSNVNGRYVAERITVTRNVRAG